MPSSSRQPPRDEDDEIDDLPPLVEGDDIEGTGEEEGVDEDDGGDGSDDAEAGDLVAADEIDEDIGDGDDDDAEDLDVGEDELDDDPSQRTADDESQGGFEEGLDLVGGLGGQDDGGEEGTEAPDPHDDEDELPPLDGDDDAEGELEPPLEDAPHVHRDAALPPWEDAAWSLVDIDAPRVSLSVVIAHGRLVTAAGDALLEVADGTRQAFARALPSTRAPVVAIAATAGGRRVVALADGDVLAIDPQEVSPLPRAPGHPFVRLETADGERATTEGSGWSHLAMPDVLALGGDGASLVALVEVSHETRLMSSTDGGRGWSTRPLPEHDATSIRSLAVAGDAIALMGSEISIARSPSSAFEAPEGCDRPLAAAFAGSSGSAPLLVLLVRDDGVYVARVGADNRATLVADLSREDEAPTSASLAWDETRGWLWIACSWGLLALAPPRAAEPR